MPTVRTVTGDVDAADLGITDAHEHVLITGGIPVMLDKDFLLDDRTRAAEEIRRFTALGGKTLVDMMPAGLGRDPDGLRQVSEETGAYIIAATGFHTERYYDTQHWLYQYSAEQIAELFRAEIEEGMDQFGYRGPVVWRGGGRDPEGAPTEPQSLPGGGPLLRGPALPEEAQGPPPRAGVIKVATLYYKWTKNTDKWFEAAAMAQRATGVPIASHTENGVLGDKQAERLIALGVPPSSIIIGHIDKNVDPYVHRELAAMGVFLEYDSPSRLKYGPDADAVRLIAAAAEHGYADRILLGLDFARRSYYPSYGGGPGLGYLLETFVPRLRAEGVGDIVDLLLVKNPARAFAMAPTP